MTLAAAGALNLEGQGGWVYGIGADAPEGAYGWYSFADVDRPGTVVWPQPLLAATRYYVFINMYDYDRHRTVSVSVGSATSTTVLSNDRDYNRLFTTRMVIDTIESSATMDFLIGSNGAGGDTSVVIRMIYITTNGDVTLTRTGIAVDLTFPSVMDDSAPVAGNLIPNSGFEVGVDAAWSLGANKAISLASIWDNTGGHSGNCQLKIPLDPSYNVFGLGGDAELISKIYHLKPNKKYTFSAWMRVDSGSNSIRMLAFNTFSPPSDVTVVSGGTGYTTGGGVSTTGGTGSGLTVSITASGGVVTSVTVDSPGNGYLAGDILTVAGGDSNCTVAVSFTYADIPFTDITVTTSWQRFSLTDYLISYPTPDFYFLLHVNEDSAGNFLYVDDVQLEEGDTATTYAASHPVEVQIDFDESTQSGHIVFTTDILTATLRAYNSTAGSLTKTLRYDIYDWLNRTVRSGSVPLTLTAGEHLTTTFDISTVGQTGAFRIMYWIQGEDKTTKEITYSLIPPTTSSVDTDSYLGTHPNFSDYPLAAYQRLGIKWIRDLSPQAVTRWEFTEPTDNTYVWQDDAVAAAVAHNMTILACPTTNAAFSSLPAFMKTGSDLNLTQLGSYITTICNHYKASIHYWEIFNEPTVHYTINQYAQMLKTCVDAIEAEDATATVIAFGGMGASGFTDTIAELDTLYGSGWFPAHISIGSTHSYIGGGAPELLTPFVDGGIAVWNTETGYWSRGPKVGPYANWLNWGKQILKFKDAENFYREFVNGTEEVVKNFARSIAAKMTKYFYYDARINSEFAVGDTGFAHHPTLLDPDGSMRTKTAAYAIAGYFLDKSLGQGNVSPVEETSSFLLFDRSGDDPIACLYSSDKQVRHVELTGVTHGQLAVYDLMGNAVSFSGTTVRYARLPVYVVGVGISLATLSAALSGGTITDTTDTIAPNVILADGPRDGTILASGTGTFRMRWLGLDDVSYPHYGEWNDEQTAPGEEPAPEAILYSYRLTPYSTWSAWIADTFVDYSGISDGAYTFEVKAKDAAGNESSVVSNGIQIGEVPSSGGARLVLISH